MQLFFKHVYPYTPVVDRLQLAQDYAQKRCSTFLLYSIFAITVPYASSGLIQNMSFSSVTDAQREFFLRARLLYDFGCEKGQLNVLQGSIFMSSFQNSFAPDKDFRFWFNNAIHMATLMGLHQRFVLAMLFLFSTANENACASETSNVTWIRRCTEYSGAPGGYCL